MTAHDVPLVGPEPDPMFVDDGCSGGSPDVLFGVPIYRGCRVHDWEYHLGRVWDQVIEGTWMGPYGPRSRNGLVHRIADAKIRGDKLKVFTYKTALRRAKEARRGARRVADRQLQENIRRMAEAAYLCGDIGQAKRALLWAAGAKYLGAVKRWGWMAIQKPGHPDNFRALRQTTKEKLAELEQEWKRAYTQG